MSNGGSGAYEKFKDSVGRVVEGGQNFAHSSYDKVHHAFSSHENEAEKKAHEAREHSSNAMENAKQSAADTGEKISSSETAQQAREAKDDIANKFRHPQEHH